MKSAQKCPPTHTTTTRLADPHRSSASSLSGIGETLLVLSGKGGVGKSTVAVQLAQALVARGARVGLLDVDLTGPSVPRLVGVDKQSVHSSRSGGWVPVYCDATQRLAVMSIAFLLKSSSDPVIWRGPKKNAVVRQFLRDVHWGELDFLVVDTPPGTSDEHISTCEYLLGEAQQPRALLVTTPQAVALNDVRKEAAFCRKLELPVLGIVENMSGYVCTKCSECTNIFSSDGGRLLAEELGMPFVGRLPIDPRVGACEDAGENFFEKFPDATSLKALEELADKLIAESKAKKEAAAVASSQSTQ